MTPASTLPRPATVRAVLPMAVLRAVLGLASIAAAVDLLPATLRATEADAAARSGRAVPPGIHGVGTVIAVVAVGVALVWLGLWLFAVRATWGGRRWAVVLLGVLSGYGVVSGLFGLVLAAALKHLPFAPRVDVPGWDRAIGVGIVVVDLVVVALLLTPASRAWVRAMNPPARRAPPPTGWPLPPGPRH